MENKRQSDSHGLSGTIEFSFDYNDLDRLIGNLTILHLQWDNNFGVFFIK